MGSYVAAPEALFAEIGCLEAAGEYRLTEVARKFLDKGARTVFYRIYDTDEVQGINTPEELDGAADIVLKRLFTPKKDTDTTIKFGTGGWRAVIGEGYTLANLRRLSQAIANEATRQGTYSKGIVIGGDRRFLSRESAEAAAEVFAGNNIPVRLLPEDVPTPLVTFAAPYLDAAYGVIITSSHNPPNWNGLKVFRADGSLPLDEETDRFQDEANALGVEDVITLDLDLAREAGIVNEEPLRRCRSHVRNEPTNAGNHPVGYAGAGGVHPRLAQSALRGRCARTGRREAHLAEEHNRSRPRQIRLGDGDGWGLGPHRHCR